MSKKIGYIGLSSDGSKFFIKEHPRKELLEQLNATHADKMYRDTTTGKAVHVGYIIAGLWIEVYEIREWKEVAEDEM